MAVKVYVHFWGEFLAGEGRLYGFEQESSAGFLKKGGAGQHMFLVKLSFKFHF